MAMEVDDAVAAKGWVVRDLEGLRSLRAGWNDLVPATAPPTHGFTWTEAAAQTFYPHRRLAVVGVGSPTAPRGLAPLVCDSTTPFRPYWQIGAAELTEPADLLYADPAGARELAEALVGARLPILLRRVPADSAVVDALRAAAPGRAMVYQRADLGVPFLDLDSSWSEPGSQLSSRRRADLRRARRRADEEGEVTIDIFGPDPEELPATLDEAMAVEARSWKGRGGTALVHDARRAAFFRAWALEMSAAGVLRVGFLRIDKHAVAMQLSVEHGDIHWILKIGYDDSVARCSPGSLLTSAMIADAAQRGLCRYEFLGWPAKWIETWTGAEHDLVTVAMSPLRLRGVAAFAPDAVREVQRRRMVGEGV